MHIELSDLIYLFPFYLLYLLINVLNFVITNQSFSNCFLMSCFICHFNYVKYCQMIWDISEKNAIQECISVN